MKFLKNIIAWVERAATVAKYTHAITDILNYAATRLKEIGEPSKEAE